MNLEKVNSQKWEHKERNSDADFGSENQKPKEYQHWESKADELMNRKRITDYDQKLRAAELAGLQTKASVLKQYEAHFDDSAIRRLATEIDSNKIEIYEEDYFVKELDPTHGYKSVLGIRDFPDGKICIRDTDYIDGLEETVTHEIMHDLSRQAHDETNRLITKQNGEDVLEKTTFLQSGLHLIEQKSTLKMGQEQMETVSENRSLNEGITELYTIEELLRRGKPPSFDCYSQEVGWAINLRDKVGADYLADAYFGGNVDGLKQRVNEMSPFPDAWGQLNRNMDAYARTGELSTKHFVDQILDSMTDSIKSFDQKKLERR